jgi:hypothetical protein
MTEVEKQILIGSSLGDAHITKNGVFSTGSKFKEWVDFKATHLSKYLSPNWYHFIKENGYSSTPYHRLTLSRHEDILKVLNMTLKEKLQQLDFLGLAVWLCDDGSLHKTNLFYNLSTHSFTKEEHVKYIIPYLYNFNIRPSVLEEVKSNGKVFYYTYIGKRFGAEICNKLIKTLPINCFNYKTYKGNINDTIMYKMIKVTNIKTLNYTIYDSLLLASKHLKLSVYKIREAAKVNLIIDKYKIEYFYYDILCSTTMAKASTLKRVETRETGNS